MVEETPDSESEGRSLSPGSDLGVALRTPLNPAESQLKHPWKVVTESYGLPNSVSPQQDKIMQMKALWKLQSDLEMEVISTTFNQSSHSQRFLPVR